MAWRSRPPPWSHPAGSRISRASLQSALDPLPETGFLGQEAGNGPGTPWVHFQLEAQAAGREQIREAPCPLDSHDCPWLLEQFVPAYLENFLRALDSVKIEVIEHPRGSVIFVQQRESGARHRAGAAQASRQSLDEFSLSGPQFPIQPDHSTSCHGPGHGPSQRPQGARILAFPGKFHARTLCGPWAHLAKISCPGQATVVNSRPAAPLVPG